MIRVFIATDSRYKVTPKPIRAAVIKKLAAEGVSDNAEVSIAIVGKRKMADLCKQYMDDGQEHDVLSFPLEEDRSLKPFTDAPDQVRRLGDIVVSYPMAVEQAAEKNIFVSDSLIFLIEHAIMHLLGHHHDDGIGDPLDQFVTPH